MKINGKIQRRHNEEKPIIWSSKVIHLHECSSLKVLHKKKIIIESWTEGRV